MSDPGPSVSAGGTASSLVGKTLGGFTLREQVGAGGFGDVYLADQTGLGREAVVKVLRPSEIDDTRVQRFLREAQLASQLDHPYAAHIYAFGAETDGIFWIAMERVRGSSLGDVLEVQGAMSIERFVPFFERICEVVHTAHEQGIVHRDLKPDNVMVISRAGRMLPKLLDFGVARAVANDRSSGSHQVTMPTAAELAAPASAITKDSGVIGSPPYMAPELWVAAKDAGPAADQYALAALAYEALTKRRAFSGKTVMEIARAHARSTPAPLGDGFPIELDAVIRRALAKKPADRFGNVLELAQALRAASGIGGASVDLPQLDDALRQQVLTRAPQPIADAVAAYDAAKNAHQAREALRGIVRCAAWYTGVVALACRTRVGAGGSGDAERARQLLRDLRQQGLSPAGWIALAEQLTAAFARTPDTHPIPELVLALHPASGANPFAIALEGTLAEPLTDPSEDAASQAVARELPVIAGLIRAISFLDDYILAFADGGRAFAWMGVRTTAKRAVQLARELPPRTVALVDATSTPIVVMSPLVQVQIAVPGHEEFLFLLQGPGRRGAKLVSPQHAFEHDDATLWDWYRAQLFSEDDARSESAIDDMPYRGLASYQARDAAWYVGRERETEGVVNRLKLEAFVAVVGPSGVGKSSFVHAGVVPALVGWKVVTTRPGRAPIAQLGAALARAGVELGNLRTAAEAGLDALAADLAAATSAAGGLIIVLDQFEELFTLGAAKDERELFVQILLAAARTPDVPLRVVVTLRDDFLIRAEQLPGLGDALARGLQLLGPLAPAALERILVEPAKRAGFAFEDPALPARMVADIAGTPAAVALISFCATRLWDLRDRHFKQLPKKAYDAIGGVAGALAQHADDTVEAMPVAERTLVRKAFRHLVTFEGTRAVLDRAELEQLIGGGTDATRLVEHLVNARLLTVTESDSGGASVEIVHEALLGAWPRLVEWRREDAEGSRFHEQLRAAAKQWHDRGRPKGLLWRGDALAEYQLWRKRHPGDLAAVEAAFGDASTADAMRGRRIRRTLAALTIGVAVAVVVVLWRSNVSAQRARETADASRVVAESAKQRQQDLLREASLEQGRLSVLGGHKLDALAPLENAIALGENSSAARLLLGEVRRATRAKLFTLEGHADKLWGIAYSPAGTLIATASADTTVRLWDADTGAPKGVLSHRLPVQSLTFNPGGTLLATGEGPAVTIWDVASKRELTRIQHEATKPSFYLNNVSFSADSKLLVASDRSGSYVWNLTNNLLATRLRGLDDNPSASFASSANCLFAWDSGGNADLYEVPSLRRRMHVGNLGNLSIGAISPDCTRMAVATKSGGLAIISPTGLIARNEHAHDEAVFALAISDDSKVVVTGSDDARARIWDALTGNPIATLAGHHSAIRMIALSDDNQRVATGSADHNVLLWDRWTGQPIGELNGHTNDVMSLAFRPGSKQLASAAWDHRAIVWDVAIGSRSIPLGRITTSGASFSPDSRWLILHREGGVSAVMDATQLRESCRIAGSQPDSYIVWSRSSKQLAIVSHSSDIRIWDLPACKEHSRLVAAGEVSAVDFGVDRIATSDDRGDVRLWNSLSGELLRTLHVGNDKVSAIELVENQLYLQRLSAPPRIDTFSLSDGKPGFTFVGESLPFSAFKVDPMSSRLYAGSFDQHVWTWNTKTGQLLGRLEGTGPLLGLAISPDRGTLAGLGGLSPALWDTRNLKLLGQLDGHSDYVSSGFFLDNSSLVTCGEDSTVRIWDVEHRRELLRLEEASSATMRPDGRALVLTGPKGARYWEPTLSPITNRSGQAAQTGYSKR